MPGSPSPPDSSPHPALCIGCGRDHRAGSGCGYDRSIRWTAYGPQERFKHVRLFPVMVGLGAAAIAVFFVVHPPEAPHMLYLGVGLPSLIAVLFGGFGTRAVIEEVRKRRWRVNSTDGRDRALVVFVGKELRYAFGESLKYEPAPDLAYAAALSSHAALALLRSEESTALMDPDLASWLRRDCEDETLLRDLTVPDIRLAIVIAMAVLGLAGRHQAGLFVGRYSAWGRGGGKLPKNTRGTEVALESLAPPDPPDEAGTNQGEGDSRGGEPPPYERELLTLAAPSEDSPTALDSLIDAIADGRDAATLLRDLGDLEPDGSDATGTEVDVSAARDAWERVQQEDGELVMKLLQHALPGRPGTIGGVTEGSG